MVPVIVPSRPKEGARVKRAAEEGSLMRYLSAVVALLGISATLLLGQAIAQAEPSAPPECPIKTAVVVTDKPDKPEQITPAKTVTDTGIAPYIFLEGAPNFGFANGVVNVTLAAVAKAAGARQPVLYVKFRKDGIPVDPSPWWAANESQKERG